MAAGCSGDPEAPQSLPAYRFVASLNEMNNIHERRLTVLRNHVPPEVMVILIAISMVAMGFTGYHAGVVGTYRRIINLIVSVTVAVLIMLVIDLDRPSRGLIVVPVQPLIDAARHSVLSSQGGSAKMGCIAIVLRLASSIAQQIGSAVNKTIQR